MGVFSWMYADKKEVNIKIGDNKNFTLLFPDGDKWTDNEYDGYGHITNPDNDYISDVYALLAIWNRDDLLSKLNTNELKESYKKFVSPCEGDTSNYLGEDISKYFNLFFDEKVETNLIYDYLCGYNGKEPDEDPFICDLMSEGIRLIGIEIACNNKYNCPYKLKFVSNPELNYDDVMASETDRKQGSFK